MKEETALAATDAGFDFEPERHLLMEPIAAALAYTQTDSRDPLRILTYDFGGGTLDITVMERLRGVITIKAFGGNRLFGGYNFDRALADELLRRLKDRGVPITIDIMNSDHRAKYARLLRLAEDTKIKLANAPTDKTPVQINQQSIFKDDSDRPVNIVDRISREQFMELIKDDLEETITGQGGQDTKGCDAVLKEAGMTIKDINMFVLVGGSSRGPWVTDLIKRKYQGQLQGDPIIFEPDLCVAAGAAIFARSLPQEEVRGDKYRLEVDAPRQTVLPVIDIGGKIVSITASALPSGLKAVLLDRASKIQEIAVLPNGNFIFQDVDIPANKASEFRVKIVDAHGVAVIQTAFTITQSMEQQEDVLSVLTVLPKPLYIHVLEGMLPLAEEGQILPAHCDVELSRTNERDTIEIELFQQEDQIGTVVIRNVPKDAPIGSKVTLSIDVTPNNRLLGHASVYSRAGAIAVEAPVDVRIPPIEIEDISVLRRRFEEASQKLTDFTESGVGDVDERNLAKAESAKQKIERLLQGTTPDPQEVLLLLRSLEKALNPPERIEMDPPQEVFESMVRDGEQILASGSFGEPLGEEEKIFKQLKKQAKDAYARGDKKVWYQSCMALRNFLIKLTRPVEGEQYYRQLPPTPVLKNWAREQISRAILKLDAKQTELEQGNRLDRNARVEIGRLRGELDRARTDVLQIVDSTPPPEAFPRIDAILLQTVHPIENRIPFIGGPDVSAREFE